MRRGFSLLEILLSLAILGGAMAVLSQIVGTGVDAAREARDLAIARLICQAKISELILDGFTPTAIENAPVQSIDSGSSTTFVYSVDVQLGQLSGLLIVRVQVDALDSDTGLPSTSYSLVRWMIDPALGLDIAEEEELAAQQPATEGV